jgi:glycosyltransferase involved in cell wall biosynthesis
MLARLHGNLNSILRGRRRNPFRQFLHLGSVLTRARNAGIGLIVLEESICTELLALRPDFARDVFVLEEAVTNEEAVADCPAPGKPVRFAFLGVGTRAKGIEQFLSAASEVRAATAGKAEFEIIGKLHHLVTDLPVDALARPPATEPLSRDEYVRRLRRQHYVCAFYEPNYYRFSASGVLIDAIAFGKPLIVTQVPFAGDLFARFGDVGDLCRTRAEIVRAMMQAAMAPDTERYRSQVRNLALAAKARHVSALAPRMRSIVESVSDRA